MSTDGRLLQAPAVGFEYDGQDLEALSELPNYYDWILRGFREHLAGRVLEVGAGIGNFAARYADDVDDLVLLEPAANLHAPLARRFADRRHVATVRGFLEEWIEPRHRGTFDAVVLVNVLEHVEHDAAMLRDLDSLLRPGGALLLFVPALPWLYGTLDALVDHHRRYTRGGLHGLLEETGFEIADLRYFDVAGVLPWFVMGRVLKRRRFDAAAAVGFDRFVVPVSSRLERWLRLPFGKNLLAVARRPLAAEVPAARPVRRAA